VYFFGGDFIMGDIEAVDEVCRAMTNRAACIVVSAEYRLAPEHKLPGPVEDGYAAVSWVAEHAATFRAIRPAWPSAARASAATSPWWCASSRGLVADRGSPFKC
jgi:hypothetical protein